MRYFRLKKNTDILIKGAVFRMQPEKDRYALITWDHLKFGLTMGAINIVRSVKDVEQNPAWFEEVFEAMPMYQTKTEMRKR